MHDDILYSVLIPAYNAEAYLEECLDSVLAQTHRNLQVVVIDDGSTDGTAEILDRYAAEDNRLEVVHRENRGVATTRLELFRMAKGKYINFVDADDTVEPEMAEVMIGVLEKTGADIAVCGVTNTLDRSFSLAETPAPEIEKISGAQARREFLEHRRLVGSLCSKVTRRDVCAEVNCPPEIRYGEDAVMSWHILKCVSSLVFVNARLYHYRINQDSVSHVSFGAAKMTGIDTWNIISADVREFAPELAVLSNAQQCYQAGMLLYAMYSEGGTDRTRENKLLQVIRDNIAEFRLSGHEFAPKSHLLWMRLLVSCRNIAKLAVRVNKLMLDR